METERSLTVFNFNQKQVRTVLKEGEPWFVAKDVCDILELENVGQALSVLDNDEKSSINPNIISNDVGKSSSNELDFSEMQHGGRPLSIISESGLYALIFKSRKPQAQAFRKWVTSEVLPEIRKTGRYEIPVQPAVQLVGNESNLREFKVWKEFAELCGLEGNAALISADNTMRRERNISMLKIAQIELKTPDQQTLMIPTEIAEMLHLSGPREVNILLAAGGFQHKMNKRWVPTEKGKQFATLIDTGKRHSDGTMIQQPKWKETILPKLRKIVAISGRL